jgi:hypothetical protein
MSENKFPKRKCCPCSKICLLQASRNNYASALFLLFLTFIRTLFRCVYKIKKERDRNRFTWDVIGTSFSVMFSTRLLGRAIAQASHRGGPGSNPGLVMWDFVMDKSGAGAGFLRKLWFPLPIYIPSASPQSPSLSPEVGTIAQELPQCQ